MSWLIVMVALTQTPDFEVATVRVSSGSFSGSGTIIAFDAPAEDELYVLTCAHLFRGTSTKSVFVFSPHQKFHVSAKLVWIDHALDVAVVTFKATRQITGIRVAEKNDLQVGERVTSVGYPNGIWRTVKNPTVVRSTHRYYNKKRIYETTTHRSSQQGMSGGPLVDMNGELVGICSSANGEESWFVSLQSIYQAIKY